MTTTDTGATQAEVEALGAALMACAHARADAEAKVAAVLALHAPHGRLDDLHCAQHDPGSYPCATARAAGV